MKSVIVIVIAFVSRKFGIVKWNMFEAGHFFTILGLVSEIIGAGMIIQPILNLDDDTMFSRFRSRFRLQRSRPFRFSTFGHSDVESSVNDLSDSVNRRFDELERELERRFSDIESSEGTEKRTERGKETKHQRYASVGFIIFGFGLFMQIIGILLLSGIIYGN